MAFTFFFRDMHTLQHIVNNVVPYISSRSNSRIWDAGCASGQEPYSLTIMFAEKMGPFAFRNLHVYASDIDNSNLFEKIIIDGIYPEEELKRIPEELFKKYFRPIDKAGYYRVDDVVRTRIRYKKHDLLSFQAIEKDFSLILCKNVLLHFSYEEQVKVIKMFHNSLAAGGFFSTEQTQKLPDETKDLFEQVTCDAKLFRKVDKK